MQPVDAPVVAVLGFLFQHLKQGGQLELVAQLADAVLDDAGVRHAYTLATARLPVSRRS